jgi:DNA-binding transcriptional regulator YhcF (GntR family)
MNAGPVSDRVYAGLRQRILDHRYRPGERLDGAELAAQLASSVTPVRDALNRLAGEGLVETHSGEGFHVPAFDEPGLADLYRWSGEVMALATRSKAASSETRTIAVNGEGNAVRTAALFVAISSRSGNLEHARAVAGCNARLSMARMVEPELFADTDAELAELEGLHRAGTCEPLRVALRRYHARRATQAGALVRLLYRSLPEP